MLLEILKYVLLIVAIIWFGTLIWFMVQILKYVRKECEDDEDHVE